MGERPLPGRVGGKDALEEVTAEIEEKPGQHGEIVAGAEALVGKAQGCQQPGGVQPLRQLYCEQLTQAQIAAAHIAKEQEEQKAENKAQPGVQLFQQGMEGYEQQHGAADEAEHSEPYSLRGQGDKGDGGYDQAPEVYDYAPVQVLLYTPAPDKTGDEDEGPAYALLPNVDGGYAVPVRVQGVDHFHIVHEMIGHHAQHREAPEGVDAVEAGGSVFHSLLLS